MRITLNWLQVTVDGRGVAKREKRAGGGVGVT